MSADGLSGWRETTAKQSIVEFVAAVTAHVKAGRTKIIDTLHDDAWVREVGGFGGADHAIRQLTCERACARGKACSISAEEKVAITVPSRVSAPASISWCSATCTSARTSCRAVRPRPGATSTWPRLP